MQHTCTVVGRPCDQQHGSPQLFYLWPAGSLSVHCRQSRSGCLGLCTSRVTRSGIACSGGQGAVGPKVRLPGTQGLQGWYAPPLGRLCGLLEWPNLFSSIGDQLRADNADSLHIVLLLMSHAYVPGPSEAQLLAIPLLD